MPFFVRTVLKDFEGSIEPMRVLILSGYFLALLHPHSYFLAVIRKQIWLLPVLLGACLLAVACNFFTIRSGWGLVGVSAATTFVLFMKFTATYVLASRHLFRPHEYWRDYAVSVFKFVFMAAALAGLRFLWPSAERSFGLTLLQAALFTVLYAPFLWKLNKDFEIVTVLKKKFANRLLPQSGIAEAEGS
jgi:O-antigen/teichoic acid export membrane protein